MSNSLFHLSPRSGSGRANMYECGRTFRPRFPAARFFSVPISMPETTKRNLSNNKNMSDDFYSLREKCFVCHRASHRATNIWRRITRRLYVIRGKLIRIYYSLGVLLLSGKLASFLSKFSWDPSSLYIERQEYATNMNEVYGEWCPFHPSVEGGGYT
jgi:hypothetical protein